MGMPSRSQRLAAAALATVSPNVLAIRLAEHVAPAGAAASAPPLARIAAGFHAWRHRKAEAKADAEAGVQLPKLVPGFSRTAFEAEAKALYAKAMEAVSAGDLRPVKDLLSPPLLAACRAGIAEGEAATGARQGARIVRWVDAESGVASTRLVVGKTDAASAASLAASKEPDFVQLAFRAVTIQEPYASRPAAAGAAGERTKLPPLPPMFVPVLDEATQSVYYWDRASGRTQWAKPLGSQFVAAAAGAPFRIERAGCEREPLPPPPAAAAGASSAKQQVRVVHHVVFERCVRPGATAASWQIVKL